MALRLAEDWQEQIDFAVSPIGMRVGAAVGPLLFISENDAQDAPVHAVGEAINVAARLAKNTPNSLAVTNRLMQTFFSDDQSFSKQKPVELKNIGQIIFWEKSFDATKSPT